MPKFLQRIFELYRGVHLYNSDLFTTILHARPVGALSGLPSKSLYIKGTTPFKKFKRRRVK